MMSWRKLLTFCTVACLSGWGATALLAAPITDVTNAGDFIIAVDLDGGSSYPGGENPTFAIDNTVAKYLNFGK